jgi:hypothetical protein
LDLQVRLLPNQRTSLDHQAHDVAADKTDHCNNNIREVEARNREPAKGHNKAATIKSGRILGIVNPVATPALLKIIDPRLTKQLPLTRRNLLPSQVQNCHRISRNNLVRHINIFKVPATKVLLHPPMHSNPVLAITITNNRRNAPNPIKIRVVVVEVVVVDVVKNLRRTRIPLQKVKILRQVPVSLVQTRQIAALLTLTRAAAIKSTRAKQSLKFLRPAIRVGKT